MKIVSVGCITWVSDKCDFKDGQGLKMGMRGLNTEKTDILGELGTQWAGFGADSGLNETNG